MHAAIVKMEIKTETAVVVLARKKNFYRQSVSGLPIKKDDT